MVRRSIRALLSSPAKVRDALGAELSAQGFKQIFERAKIALSRLDASKFADWRSELSGVLRKVVLQADRVILNIAPLGLMDWLSEGHRESSDLVFPENWELEVPCQLARRGKQLRLVIESSDQPPQVKPDLSLLKLLGRAHVWRDQMEGDQGSLMEVLAKEHGVNPSYFARVARLAYLALDIVEAILDGKQPASVTATKLAQVYDLPIEWAAQRRRLGFPPA